ncbi:DUF4838 domain-containing protein [Desnuesiella massiliensis]|uniref:DUF4838 domain-containing protein n=1 Tax=Desnuesiella massiliensis TaxID=1650662 RepID=UPI0006E1A10A|nr:DUF4838 domain-containing protein [Desnuesiella massiliensis]
MSLNIYSSTKNATIQYAIEELIKYIKLMQKHIVIESSQYKEHSLCIGTLEELGLSLNVEVEDNSLDDYIYIDVCEGKGIISGNNPRSVLLAVYRFLRGLGFSWVRPGAQGEYIPEGDIFRGKVKVEEKPYYRHRGLCIEGAVSYDNVKDIIEWSPKVGLNSYFIQFREAYTFFERWYSHKNNSYKEPGEFNIDKARVFTKELEKEIKKRDLIYHGVGHGWTCEPLGISGLGWDEEKHELSDEVKQYLAEINGQRDIWKGIPLNTNLCYSNPEVRELIIEDIVKYIKENNAVDLLHIWLADGSNNQCECSECIKMRPSDYYIKLLNELDSRLSKENLDTRIVFLIYVDLFWPPEKESIKNKDRFIMMFAPIARVYIDYFKANKDKVEIKPYVRNKVSFPTAIEDNVAYLEAWQNMFKGDSFDFDYHFMWDHLFDPGYFEIAELIYKDVKNLKAIGLNGLISCQLQRTFLPTGLGVYAMAESLWNPHIDFEDIVEYYFLKAFGKEGIKASEYLKELTMLFDPSYMRGVREKVNKETSERFLSIIDFIEEFEQTIDKNLQLENSCHRASWNYLKLHAHMCKLYAKILSLKAKDEKEAWWKTWEELKDFITKEEDKIQPVFDVFQFITTMDKMLKVD